LLLCSFLPVGEGKSWKGIPEVEMTVPEIIRYNGYPAEVHNVTTEDGYILTLHRIPHGRKGPPQTNTARPVVFLQHGLLCSSSNWVTNPPNESFGFILADEGFDVWLGNNRGNTYSLRHRTLSVHSDAFWWFSWDEMAKYDLPAMINYVVAKTGQPQIYYSGHSQGTMIVFAELSHNTELAKKFKAFYAMGPVSTVRYMESPIKYLSALTPEVRFLFKIFGIHDFLPSNEIIRWLAEFVCRPEDLDTLCSDIIFIIDGFDKKNLNKTRVPVYLSHTPAGTSVRNMVHYAQMYLSGKFQAYDYGERENLIKYKQKTPPVYNASAFEIPVALYWGGNDWLADPMDVRNLLTVLPKEKVLYNKEIKPWQHLDFIWGLDAARLVYCDIVRHIKKTENINWPYTSSACAE